jgi:membrane protein
MRLPRDVRELLARLGRCRTLGLAAEMSFWLFLALVPLAFVAGLVAARLTLSGRGALASAFATAPVVAQELLRDQVGKVAALDHGGVAPTAIVVFVWLASSGIHSTFDAMEVETGCARPWWKKRAFALMTCVLFSLGVALVAFLAAGLDGVWKLAGAHLPDAARVAESSVVGQALRLLAGGLVAFALIAGLFAIGVPKDARHGMPILPGALVTVVLQIVFGLVYGFYVSKAGTGGAYLAGLAVVGVTMMALYLFSTAILVGVEVNVVLRDRGRASPRCA